MKAILALVSVMTLAACGTAKNDNSQASGFPGFQVSLPQPVSAEVLVFSRDARAVDGDLKVITLKRTAEGKYDVTARTAFYDRLNGKAVDKTEDLAYGMTCQINRGDYTCQVDQRPVDGALDILTIKQGESGFEALLAMTYVSRATGEDIRKDMDLGSELKLQDAAQ